LSVENTFTKHSKYAINQKLEHCDDVSFREDLPLTKTKRDVHMRSFL